jgi:hypothetical protein
VVAAFEFESDTSLFNATLVCIICGRNTMHIIRIEEESWTDAVEEKYADFHTVRLIKASEYSITD